MLSLSPSCMHSFAHRVSLSHLCASMEDSTHADASYHIITNLNVIASSNLKNRLWRGDLIRRGTEKLAVVCTNLVMLGQFLSIVTQHPPTLFDLVF